MPYPKGKPKVDLTGQRFDRLTVIEKTDRRKFRCIVWKCVCDCGEMAYIPSKNLLNGNSGSCGCLQKERQREAVALPKGESEFNRVVRVYKSNAKKRGIEFQISKEQMRELTKGNCYYCGAQPFSVSHDKNSNGDYVYNGVDRIDPAIGYKPENVVSCCKSCNVAKSNMMQGEFSEWIARAHNVLVSYPEREYSVVPRDVHESGWELDSGAIYRGYKHRGKKSGRGFSLTREEFYLMSQDSCFYCGNPPSSTSISERTKEQGYKENRRFVFVYNGLDRIDTTKGYVLSNVVPCCARCNTAKRAMTQQEFAEWVERAYNYWAKDFLK